MNRKAFSAKLMTTGDNGLKPIPVNPAVWYGGNTF
jgi:hypothetical protein